MKVVYASAIILLMLVVSGCSTSRVQQSSYNNDSAQWQKSQSKKALQELEKE